MEVSPEENELWRFQIDVRSGNEVMVRVQLSDNPELFSQPTFGNRFALHHAALAHKQQQLAVLRYLCEFAVEQGLNLNVKDVEGKTPLHISLPSR